MGTWQPLSNPPNFGASTMLLLTDGTVMCQESGGNNWWRLTPDSNGDYVNGSWSPLAPMKNTRLYYASAVLRDGRVFVAGGEYSNGGSELNAAEIFEPLLNHWTSIPTPQGWTSNRRCSVLRPAGRQTPARLDRRQCYGDLRSGSRNLDSGAQQGRQQFGGNLDASPG